MLWFGKEELERFVSHNIPLNPMLSAALNSKKFSDSLNPHITSNADSPLTQDSYSMSSVTDEYDFKTLDISSSAQTSTTSPNRYNATNKANREPKFSSFSFYSGPAIDGKGTNAKSHASQLRKSLIISPSFNSISSNPEFNPGDFDDSQSIDDSNIMATMSDSTEEPTKNIGMVISPSIRALSDILSSKVASQTNNHHATILEENEDDDNSTILFKSNTVSNNTNQISFTGESHFSDKNGSLSFHKTTSNETLKINIPGGSHTDNNITTDPTNSNKYQKGNYDTQPDLIDLSSPIVSETHFQDFPASHQPFVSSSSLNPNYSDIYETFTSIKKKDQKNSQTSEVEKNDTNNKSNRFSNRFSMMSDNFDFNNFQSPALGYGEPVQSFSVINPSISKSISKLSVASESIHEIGYDDGNGDTDCDFDFDSNGRDISSSSFSFVPRKTSILNKATKNDEAMSLGEGFVQKHNPRNSIRIVKEEDDKSPFINEFLINSKFDQSNDTTPVLNNVSNFDTQVTPKLFNVPDLPFNEELDSTPQLHQSIQNNIGASPPKSPVSSPILLNSSPIRNTSPTFENLKNSPTQKTKKAFINLSSPVSNRNIPSSPPKKKLDSKSNPTSYSTNTNSKPALSKPKQKLTFKSIFSKNSENLASKKKSPVLPDVGKTTRPKSFSFNNLTHHNNVGHEEKKEKSKSLLSGWKRKSLGFTTNNTTTINNINTNTTHTNAASTTTTINNKSDTFNATTNNNNKTIHKNKASTEVNQTNNHKREKSKSSIFNFINNQENTETNGYNKFKLYNTSQSTSNLPILDSAVSPSEPEPQINVSSSPRQHFNATPEIFDKQLPALPPPTRKDETSTLLKTYGFDDHSPKLSQSPILPKSPQLSMSPIEKHVSPTWEKNPTVKRSESQQTIETSESPVNLPEPQSAKLDQTTPVIPDSETLLQFSPKPVIIVGDDNIVNDSGNEAADATDVVNSSSTYDTTANETLEYTIYDTNKPNATPDRSSNTTNTDDLMFFKPPKALGITSKVPTLNLVNESNHDNSLLRTPIASTSPTLSVGSFVSSPNKYHIGDDIFPKKLGANEIESIVSLERSRSLKSVRSVNGGVSHKNSILRMVHDTGDGINEILMPDGMVVVKSPKIDQASLWSKPSRRSSILKHSITDSLVQPNTKDNVGFQRESMLSEDREINNDFEAFIDLINFDNDDDKLNTKFDIDTAMDLELSPIHKIARDSSVPDFLGVETSYGSMKFDDILDHDAENEFEFDNDSFEEEFSDVEDYDEPHRREFYTAQPSAESIQNIIQEEEKLHNVNYSTQSLHDSFKYEPSKDLRKGLQGPTFTSSFNSGLKPETKSAIIGSLAKQQSVHSIAPSDSDNSFSYIAQDYKTNFTPVPENHQYNRHTDENSYDTYNDYANYINTSPVHGSPSNTSYSLNNPFTDYTQSYDDDYAEAENIPAYDDRANKRKSLSFINKLSNTSRGHQSTSSLPVMSTTRPEEKQKKLTRRRNRTSVSFGSMFDSLIPHKEDEAAKPNVKFSSRILLYDTYGGDEYDRKPDSATCNSLTPQLALQIKNELNELKSEMPIHEDSRCYTHFF